MKRTVFPLKYQLMRKDWSGRFYVWINKFYSNNDQKHQQCKSVRFQCHSNFLFLANIYKDFIWLWMSENFFKVAKGYSLMNPGKRTNTWQAAKLQDNFRDSTFRDNSTEYFTPLKNFICLSYHCYCSWRGYVPTCYDGPLLHWNISTFNFHNNITMHMYHFPIASYPPLFLATFNNRRAGKV